MKINFNKIIKLCLSIILCEFAGVIGSVFTTSSIGSWYKNLEKPVFNPPSWIFAPVWSALFLLMGIAFYLAWEAEWKFKNEIKFFKKIKLFSVVKGFLDKFSDKTKTISIFYIQLVLNILWSVAFFGMHNVGLAFVGLLLLWLAIALTAVAFYRISKTAGYLFYPYLVWVAFAGFLNFSIWILN